METGPRKIDAIELKRLADIYQRPIACFTGDAGEPAGTPEAVQHLARAVAKLTHRFLEERLQFAQFLHARKR